MAEYRLRDIETAEQSNTVLQDLMLCSSSTIALSMLLRVPMLSLHSQAMHVAWVISRVQIFMKKNRWTTERAAECCRETVDFFSRERTCELQNDSLGCFRTGHLDMPCPNPPPRAQFSSPMQMFAHCSHCLYIYIVLLVYSSLSVSE